MPDFQQFADKCQLYEGIKRRLSSGSVDEMQADVFREAERHDRQLQQIWEWVERPDAWENTGEDYQRAKAHVRSLLVGQQEAK